MFAKDAGFFWDKDKKVWFTPNVLVAARLGRFADERLKNLLMQKTITVVPWTTPLPETPAGLQLLPHQVVATIFALERNNSYLALDPRLGKTICAIMIAKATRKRMVYITPPFLINNLEEEFKRWAPELMVVQYGVKDYEIGDVLLLKDSLLSVREGIAASITNWAGKDAVLVVDECHRFKTKKSQRTKALLGSARKGGLADHFPKRVYMSGTPMPNRPIELYPILDHSAPQTIDHMSEFQFALRYCNAHQNSYGWDFSGASNVKELARSVIFPSGPFMLRQKKSMLKMPPKIEEIFIVSDKLSPRLRDMDKGIGERYSDVDDIMKHKISAAENSNDLHLGTYRRLLGSEKVAPAVEYLSAVMAESSENVLVFAYHIEVVEALRAGLEKFSPLVINGKTRMEERHSLVKKFQAGESRVLIGNFHAMGVGFTLSKADRVLFVEFDWVPGVNEQAADRACHLDKKDSVFVQYMVYKNSVDHLVIETLLRKRRIMRYI